MVGLISYILLLPWFSQMTSDYAWLASLVFAVFIDVLWGCAILGIWSMSYSTFNTDLMIECLSFKSFKTYFPKLTDVGLIIWYVVYIGSSIYFTLFLLLTKLFKFIFIKQEPERKSVFNEDYKYKNFNHDTIEDCKD